MFTNAELKRLIPISEGIFIQGLHFVDNNVGYQLSREGALRCWSLSPLVVE